MWPVLASDFSFILGSTCSRFVAQGTVLNFDTVSMDIIPTLWEGTTGLMRWSSGKYKQCLAADTTHLQTSRAHASAVGRSQGRFWHRMSRTGTDHPDSIESVTNPRQISLSGKHGDFGL